MKDKAHFYADIPKMNKDLRMLMVEFRAIQGRSPKNKSMENSLNVKSNVTIKHMTTGTTTHSRY